MSGLNPILNSPYEEPQLHYATDEDGSLNYIDIRSVRRIFTPDIQPIPTRQNQPGSIFEIDDYADEFGGYPVNLLRSEIGKWRESLYPGMTRVTKELLSFWFTNPERHAVQGKYGFGRWHLIEISKDIRNIRRQLLDKIKTINL